MASKDSLIVNRIIPTSNVDGPGNRYAIFLQGCNLNCKYCHNPETINSCRQCGRCVDVCPQSAISIKDGSIQYDRGNCISCDKCVLLCKNSSSPKTQNLTVADILLEIEKYQHFISGITVSGGEATLQYKGIIKLFKEVKSKMPHLTCCVDTNGKFDINSLKELVSLTDYFILDIKAYDLTEHKEVTDKENTDIIYNFKKLKEMNKLYEVRTVVSPSIAKSEETVVAVSKELANFDVFYKLIKYRNIGVRKNICDFVEPTDKYMNQLKELGLKYHNRIGCV